MKVALVAVIAVAAGLGVGAALWARSDDGPDSDPVATAAPGAGDLFVVTGRLASTRSTGQGAFEVGVKGATVLWFSDRPARLNGNRPIGRFVAAWPSLFGGDPPNAAILAPSDEQSRRPIPVELGRPSFDRSTGVARFRLRPERDSGDREADRLAKLDRAPRSDLERVVLFVDNAVPPPSPYLAETAAFEEGMHAIDVLQSLAASGGSLSASAAADLQVLQQAATGR